jgi:hypothetical protein
MQLKQQQKIKRGVKFFKKFLVAQFPKIVAQPNFADDKKSSTSFEKNITKIFSKFC